MAESNTTKGPQLDRDVLRQLVRKSVKGQKYVSLNNFKFMVRRDGKDAVNPASLVRQQAMPLARSSVVGRTARVLLAPLESQSRWRQGVYARL